MNKKILTLILTTTMLSNYQIMTTNAIEPTQPTTVSTETEQKATGIIYDYNISVAIGNDQIIINGLTKAKEEVKTIGFKDIVVQRSSNGSSWTDVTYFEDKLASSQMSYSISNQIVNVTGGYYYRVVCTHYAKEKGLFGSSQSIENTSNTVWIS